MKIKKEIKHLKQRVADLERALVVMTEEKALSSVIEETRDNNLALSQIAVNWGLNPNSLAIRMAGELAGKAIFFDADYWHVGQDEMGANCLIPKK